MNTDNNFNSSFKKICKKARLVGASIVVRKDGKIVESANYGYQSLENKQYVDSDTIFRIASISKTVGAIGLLMLVEQQKISLDDDISSILGFTIRNPKYKDIPITVKMITLQTSSITDGYDDENPAYDNIRLGYNGVNGTNLEVSLQDLLLEDGKYYTPLTFSDYMPGERFIYSNFGCGLMACIIEKVSNMRYIDYMDKYVFAPLGLDASFTAKNIKKQDSIASLYYPNNQGGYNIARTKEQFIEGCYLPFPIGNGFRGPAGGLFISMKDLSIIMQLLINRGKYQNIVLLKPETVDYMYQMHWCGSGDNGEYRAKGIQMKILHNFPSVTFRGHTGGAYGVRSYMFFDNIQNLGICFITNGGYYQHTSSGILDIFDETISLVLDKYCENMPTKFTFAIGSTKATINERTICLPFKPYLHEEEIYLPLLTLADGLNIVPFKDEDTNIFTFKKDDKEVSIKPTKIDNEFVVPLYYILNKLNLHYQVKDNIVIVE